MKALKHFLFIHLLFLCFLAQAQVKTNFNNETIVSNKGQFVKDYKTKVDFEIPAKKIVELLEKEKREIANYNEIKPFKLAVPVSVNLDIANLINWAFDKGYAYGKFTVKLNGALSSSINFDQFYLPEGTEMYVYNENGNMITGAVTENENNTNKNWGSWVYKGEFLTIEIKTPLASKEQLLLHSNNIAYGYKEVYTTKVGGFGQSGACNINVLCPLGNGWEPERNSVALGISGDGAYTFSGSMITNTCDVNRPFFLTANHVYTDVTPVQNVTNWRFTFQAWSATCTPSQNSDGVTYNGSTLRANWANSDFCLVELNNIPPANSGINYAGWTRSATPAQNATGIHHPSGDVMKISSAANPIAISSLAGFPVNHHWQTTWTQGVTEGGSSGSPLFDQNHRIVGQLTGGPSICGGSALRDYYGRFDLSWTGGGTNATRLSNWLDPSNSGATATNTTNIASLINAPVPNAFLSMTGNNVVCGNSQIYTINGVGVGATINWQLLRPIVGNGYQLPPQSICSMVTTGNQATLTKIANGNVRLAATITYCGGVTQYAGKDVTFGVSSIANNGAYAPNNGWYTTITSTVHFTTGTTTAISMANPYNNTYTFTKGPGSSPNSSLINWANGNVGVVFTPPVNSQSKINLSVQTSNACGTNNSPLVLMYNGTPVYFRVSPNPANDFITIEQMDGNGDKAVGQTNIQLVEIVDKMGMIGYRRTFAKGTPNNIKIPINQLRNDVYTVRIFDGKEWKSEKIIIEH